MKVPVEALSRALNALNEAGGLRTPIVRVDMSREGIYEIETQPSIIYPLVLTLRGTPLEEKFIRGVQHLSDAALRTLASDVEFYERGCQLLGWRHVKIGEPPSRSGERGYLSGASWEVFLRTTRQGWRVVTDFVAKDDPRLLKITRGVSCSSIEEAEIMLLEDPEFEQGVVAKSPLSWGSKEVAIFSCVPPFKKRSITKSRLKREIARLIEAEGRVLLQPFYPPEIVREGVYGIWRIYCVNTRGFTPLVALFNYRPSLKVHGASDATFEVFDI